MGKYLDAFKRKLEGKEPLEEEPEELLSKKEEKIINEKNHWSITRGIPMNDRIFNETEFNGSREDFVKYQGKNIISYVLNNRNVCMSKLSLFKKSKEKIKFRIISKLEYQIEGKVKLIKDNFVHIETEDKKEIFINLDEIDCRTIFPLSYDPVKYPNRYVSDQIREYVFKRDDYKCQLKLEGCTGVVEEIDHIIPVSKGGESIIENLQASCLNCNRKKGDKY